MATRKPCVKKTDRLSIVALDKDNKIITITTMKDVHPTIVMELAADAGKSALLEALGDDPRAAHVVRTMILTTTDKPEKKDEGKKQARQ